MRSQGLAYRAGTEGSPRACASDVIVGDVIVGDVIVAPAKSNSQSVRTWETDRGNVFQPSQR